MGALRPAGTMTTALQAGAERVTIRNALVTFSEFLQHMVHCERKFPPSLVDIDAFLHEGTTAPTRSLNSLKWLCKQAQVDWGVQQVQLDPSLKKQHAKKGRQAATAEPGMLEYLEERIEALYRGRTLVGLAYWATG